MSKKTPLTRTANGHRRVRRGNEDDVLVMRKTLLEATQALFQEGGVDAITIRSVAQRAQVSVMTPYRYFSNKAELLSGLWASVVGELVAQQKQAIAPFTDPRDRLRANILAYLRFWQTHPEHYQLVYMPPLNSVGEIKLAVQGSPAQTEVWTLSEALTREFAAAIGGDPQRVAVAAQLRHFVVMGFLHTSLVNHRPHAEFEQLVPVVVDQAIAACERYLLQKPDPARQYPP